MAVNALRTTTITYTGDVSNTIVETLSNSNSPGQTDLITLASGANTIAVPTGGSAPVSCTIVPPLGNTISITLKGVSGDTGIKLNIGADTTISLDPTQTSFVLTAGASLVGVRLIWV